jgi:hypothetical protein
MEQTKLFKDMTADEQLQWATDFSTFAQEKLPVLEQLGDAWEACHVKSMRDGLALLNAFQFCRDFVSKALHYGDYAARVNRLRFYIELIRQKQSAGDGTKGTDGRTYAIVPQMKQKAPRRGRPASAATIARREAEAKAAEQQTNLFGAAGESSGTVPAVGSNGKAERTTEGLSPVIRPTGTGAPVQSVAVPQQPAQPAPFIAPTTRDDLEYKLSIAQKRAFLSPDLQQQADLIRALRTTAGAAAEKAKTMAELKAAPELIAPVAEEAQRTLEQVEAIYAAIDVELATTWYRLQNDEPYKEKWLAKYGFKGYEDLHQDLIHDLRKHYAKVKSDEFDLRMKTLIEQESPEYVARQAEEAARKKEVQDILRYFKRKDQSQKLETARLKFSRLTELLGKKEAADYRPLLQKIEDDAREAEKEKKSARKPTKGNKTTD